MLNDFAAVGGRLTFVLGLSIAQIRQISAVNLLPALVLIWPCSWLFGLLVWGMRRKEFRVEGGGA